MGLPHRNYSVLKQAAPNKQKVKESDPPSAVGGLKGKRERTGLPLFSEGNKGSGGG